MVSNGSCTTNCLAPVAKVLLDLCGIERGYMTTIHSYTGDQPTLDTLHKDLYRARAAGLSMIPTSTGAAKALGLVLPELAGKLDGSSIRVPTANVSVVDLKIVPGRAVTRDEINEAMSAAAAKGPLRGVLAVTNDPLVSIDLNHIAASSTVALPQTQVVDGKLGRVLSWYDNEWGFSTRMADIALAHGQARLTPVSFRTPRRPIRCGASAPWSAWTSTCRWRTARSPTTPACAPPCRPSSACATAGPR